jgi:hypothetical protein
VHAPVPTPPRIPQRALVAGTPGPLLTGALERLAATLDLPLVPLDGLAGEDLVRLAEFEGWVATADRYDARAALLPRADLVVVVLTEEPGTLRSLVRRTVRRMRSEVPEVDLAWVEALAITRPSLEVVRLVGTDAVDAWLASLA